jgi:hypothetical protein
MLGQERLEGKLANYERFCGRISQEKQDPRERNEDFYGLIGRFMFKVVLDVDLIELLMEI